MAEIDIRQGQYESARARLAESMAAFQTEGNRQFMNMARSGMADVARLEGDDGTAIALYRETIKVWQELGHPGAMARCFECLAFIAIAQSDALGAMPQLEHLKWAARLIGAAAAQREGSGAIMTRPELKEFEDEVDKLRARLGDEQFQSARAEGHALTMEQARQLALTD